jgi:F-type H+-transporting ATPase subunit b
VISLDSSIIPAIIIFLLLIIALDSLLFKPLMRVQAERASRTSGLVFDTQKQVDRQVELFSRYQASLKNARLQGYRHQEQVRAEAMKKRAEVLESARFNAEQLIQASRASIQSQVATAKEQLGRDAQEIARNIVTTVLQRN